MLPRLFQLICVVAAKAAPTILPQIFLKFLQVPEIEPLHADQVGREHLIVQHCSAKDFQFSHNLAPRGLAPRELMIQS